MRASLVCVTRIVAEPSTDSTIKCRVFPHPARGLGAGVNRILVVEDEADLAVTYDRLLRRQGYRVVTAASRAEGLESIESAPPALVIADLRLPDGNGIDIIRAA